MKNILLLLTLLVSSFSFAQDMIYMNDGSIIESKVVEIEKKEIKYKKFKNLSGPDYRIQKEDVIKITYESGAEDVFNESKNSKSRDKNLVFGNNIIYINVVDILFQNVTLGYEHFLGDQKKLGIRVPVSFSLYGNNNNNFNLWNSYNVFYSGVDLNYYPIGQRQASFFIGPSIRYGMARYRYNETDGFGFGNQTFITTGSYASVLFQSGFIWNPVKELTITSSLGIGSRRYFTTSPNNRNTVTTASLWFAFGYRF
jgi:hypothetical protein